MKATFTYLACGTNPLSWLKERPYTNIKTHCGYVSIESIGNGMVKQVEDVYGMSRGHRPAPIRFPSWRTCLSLSSRTFSIMQTGTNLFDLFPDHKTVIPNRHGPMLRSYLAPFIAKAVKSPSHVEEDLLGRVTHVRKSVEGNPGFRASANARGHWPYRPRHR